ncbi:hypothetical protein L596_003542 [Steinernema carpocapsae]|uniref:Smr domain-containing protein n=1 Tax=Steinernema carpocapsae TaxID=34508 RepID=A0A4U8USY1_STECR|nr:hypothetical protein L596_003542 [Steinernema carpocapsae]
MNDQMLALELHTKLKAATRDSLLTTTDYAAYRRLCQEFEHLKDRVDCWDLFLSNDYSYEATRETLRIFASEHEEQPSTAEISMSKVVQSGSDSEWQSVSPRQKSEAKPRPKNPTFTDVQEHAMEFMDESRKNHEMHREFMAKASKHAGNKKTPGAAEYYRQEAKKYKVEAERQLAMAHDILYDYNMTAEGTTIDLHLLNVQNAISLLKLKLSQLDREARFRSKPSNKRLSVVTGYGKSNGGNCRVKPAVENWLKRNNYQYNWDNKGCLQVICK